MLCAGSTRVRGLLVGASLFVVMKAFASGGSALTGTEAISNSVSVFRQPEARNARITLVIMSLVLGSLVLGVAALAAIVHPVPYLQGTPTVVAQVARYVRTDRGLRPRAALPGLCNTGNRWFHPWCWRLTPASRGFPFWPASPPRTRISPDSSPGAGIGSCSPRASGVLTVVSIALLLVTGAHVDSLIPLYAIGVFTGFTMAGAGMVKYHLTNREPHWRRGAVINGTAAVLSLVVDV